ncbi:ABC transporter ATP-binding protein [Halorussus sp. MSC15.2]|uniref:ABC transporter ATP-binding protein n=1 Tax=Halorussus sp. MSC15.2 TaxID=2283638 RepID=UPI0013D862A9|nr:ABC transporter ATP-binding protein [Halorussus sp. MSC15.2]NEU58716.1 ABC transporter ATP-binding protein [Halorussus sp. MSC15.2]
MKTDEPPAIRVEGLKKTFGDGESAVTAIDDISFEIERGTVVGILGPNGAGKTTTIKSMLGLILPDAGDVEITGRDVHEQPNYAYENVGAILEGARNIYWKLTVQENLSFFAGIGGDNPSDLRDRHETLLKQFDLDDYADTPVNDLSRGMKQKVSLASTLARDVDVVFMDEPTLGLDIETSLELRTELNRLANEDVTIVLCSHDMDVIETVCDSVLILNDGSIIEYDEVDALLDLFHTRQYEITLERPVANRVRQRLEQTVAADITETDNRLTATFTVVEGNEIYDAVNILQDDQQDIREITSVEPDLEDVFLRLTETDPRPTDDSRAVQEVSNIGD